MEKHTNLIFPLPFVRPDDSAVNEALKLFFGYLVLHYDNIEWDVRACSEETLKEYITKLVIDEIESLYENTNGYLYTATPQPISELEKCVFINKQFFNETVEYMARHMHNSILPAIKQYITLLMSRGFNVVKTTMEWFEYNPISLTVVVDYY